MAFVLTLLAKLRPTPEPVASVEDVDRMFELIELLSSEQEHAVAKSHA